MTRKYECVSVDTHLEVPCDRWTPRVAKEYRDRAPRFIHLPVGGDAWVIEGRPLYRAGQALWAGKSVEQWSPREMIYEGAAGAGSPEQRVREQDADGIDAEVLFPGSGVFGESLPEDDAYLAIVRAYNDFLAEDYCAVAPERLIGLGMIPERGLRYALDELERCARLGLKAVVLSAYPSGKFYPTPEDDEFWTAALGMNMPITVHVEIGARGAYRGPLFKYPRDPGWDPAGQDIILRMLRKGQGGAKTAVQLMMAGVFDRFPLLQVYFAETSIGWIPHFLEQMDMQYERHRHWAERLFGLEPLARAPSEYVKEHCLWGFQDDPIGVHLRHFIGIDQLMWATDFPHADATDWPHSQTVVERNFADVPDDEKHKIVAGNAVRFFHLDNDSSTEQRTRAAAVVS